MMLYFIRLPGEIFLAFVRREYREGVWLREVILEEKE